MKRTKEQQGKAASMAVRKGMLSRGGPVDPRLVRFLGKWGIRLVGPDIWRSGQVLWRREPVVRGDPNCYEFTTTSGIKFESFGEVLDSVYECAYNNGEQAIRSEIKRLLGCP